MGRRHRSARAEKRSMANVVGWLVAECYRVVLDMERASGGGVGSTVSCLRLQSRSQRVVEKKGGVLSRDAVVGKDSRGFHMWPAELNIKWKYKLIVECW